MDCGCFWTVGVQRAFWSCASSVLEFCLVTSAVPFCVRLSERRTAPSCAVSASRRTDGRSSSQPTAPACCKLSSRSPRAALSRAQYTQLAASRLLRVRSLLFPAGPSPPLVPSQVRKNLWHFLPQSKNTFQESWDTLLLIERKKCCYKYVYLVYFKNQIKSEHHLFISLIFAK